MSAALQRTLPSSPASSQAGFDRLRDHDELGWLVELEEPARSDWLRLRGWLQKVDRLAVDEPRARDAESFANHYILPCEPLDLGVTWREAWRGYIGAAHKYHQPGARRVSLAEHHQMLLELGGNLFCLFPEVNWSMRHAIAQFGALDRFFLDLRDLSRDPARGAHHFPLQLLKRFGLQPADLASRSKRSQPAYRALMQFWLDDYLPLLRLEAAEFSQLATLPAPLRLLRRACLRRHARIEAMLRECCLDFERAGSAYWLDIEHRVRMFDHATRSAETVVHPFPRRLAV